MAVRPDHPGARVRLGVYPHRAMVWTGDRAIFHRASGSEVSIKIIIAGRSGRMSKALADAIARDKDFELPGSFGRGDDPLPLIAKAEALIDFTEPKISVELAALAAQARIVHVIGTTGFSAEDEAKIRAAARHAVIVKSGNMSLGVNVLASLVKQAAKALPGYDLRIFEMHHKHKVD